MATTKPFLAKFSRTPRHPATDDTTHPKQETEITPNPRPTIITEVQNETTDDN